MNPNRTSIAHYLSIVIFACFGALHASADDKTASPFVGEWCNKDFATGGITRVHVRQEETKLIAHVWGRCSPTECDWGDAVATVEENGKVLSVTWTKAFKTEIHKLKVLADGSLELVGHSHFTDNSGRSDRDNKYTFAKGLTHDWNDPPKK